MRWDDAGSYGSPPIGRGSKRIDGRFRQIRISIQTLKRDGVVRTSVQTNESMLCRQEKSLSFS